jgi:hypothetical protein
MTETELTGRFAKLRAEQKTNPADVADGLIGIAQKLEQAARRLRENAKQVRRGEYLSDFAYRTGRNVKYDVAGIVDGELPEVEGL